MDEKNSDVKAHIKSVATELFIKNGYKETSVRDIAAISGNNPAMVNYYFQSKNRLFEEIFRESFDLFISRFFPVFESERPFFEIVELLIDVYYDMMLENPHISLFILNEIGRDPERMRERIVANDPQKKIALFLERIDREVEAGNIVNMPSSDILLNIVSLLVFPFAFRAIATSLSTMDMEDYNKLLESHREWVLVFVINALKPVCRDER